MKLRIPYLTSIILALCSFVIAETAQDITWVQEGYTFIAKLPCIGCPFLYEDTSQGEKKPWSTKQDINALLLNISLPYDSTFIAINNARLYPTSSNLPIVYANQILSDLSSSDLTNILSTNQLESSHEISLGGGFFGLSYRYTLRRIPKTAALIFQLDILELHSDLTEKPIKFELKHEEQKMIELLLLQRPIYSAHEPPSFEIIKASLVPRTSYPISVSSIRQRTMHFRDWDEFGQKGTPTHLISTWGTALVDYLDSGVWALFFFLLAIIALFIVVCLFCIFGCDFCKDDYEKAQSGKARGERRKKSKSDLETGKIIFKSAEELGLMGRGKLVGLGKND
ncbi:hypothetical protein B0J11DRAFT_522195 [Dendryphion nanum]|uniref:Uncharacterized protein n=1 Tax=Dendryphion nanum TaxID=256645 RepID=A0A9P9E8N2_9PLEO|nr:hypothetical protein B0J11DRAFT_522195 [Dendryphion nanum]